jgi:hypothetical protein
MVAPYNHQLLSENIKTGSNSWFLLSLFSNFPQKVEQKIVMDISRNVSQIK